MHSRIGYIGTIFLQSEFSSVSSNHMPCFLHLLFFCQWFSSVWRIKLLLSTNAFTINFFTFYINSIAVPLLVHDCMAVSDNKIQISIWYWGEMPCLVLYPDIMMTYIFPFLEVRHLVEDHGNAFTSLDGTRKVFEVNNL